MQAMNEYDWPGNIRELKNLIERCILLGKPPAHYWNETHGGHNLQVSPTVDSDTSEFEMTPVSNVASGEGYPNNWTLKEVEKAHIQQVVSLHDGNKSAAARDLGVARKTLERKYKEWDAEEEEYAD